jgi:hypothetical protein
MFVEISFSGPIPQNLDFKRGSTFKNKITGENLVLKKHI